MMDAYEKGGEEELAKEMKMSMEELDDELNDILRNWFTHGR